MSHRSTKIILKITDILSLNQNPVAVISSPDPTVISSVKGKSPFQVKFEGDKSYAPYGNITGYLWDFGDNKSSAKQNPNHNYMAPGTYTAELTVTDDDGAKSLITSQSSVMITVFSPNAVPTASLTVMPTQNTSEMSFTGVATDTDGTIDTFILDYGDGQSWSGTK